MKWQTTLVVVIVVIVYAVLGAIVFSYIEKGHEEDVQREVADRIANFLASNPCVDLNDVAILHDLVDEMREGGLRVDDNGTLVNSSRWDILTSFFVATELVATVGYNPSAPKSVGGRVLTVIGAFIGIPLFALIAIGIGQLLNLGADRLLRLIAVCCCRPRLPPGSSPAAVAAAENLSWKSRVGRRRRYVYRMLLITVVGFVLFLLFPSLIFRAIEHWTYGEAIYYCLITVLTIGFGDFVPGYGMDPDWKYIGIYRLGVACWLLIEIGWFAGITSSVHKLIVAVAEKTEKGLIDAVDEMAVEPRLPPDVRVHHTGSKSLVTVEPANKKKGRGKSRHRNAVSTGDVSNVSVQTRDKYGDPIPPTDRLGHVNSGMVVDSNALSYMSVVKIGPTS